MEFLQGAVVLAQQLPEVTDTIDWITRGGTIGLLVVWLYGFWKEWWVPGSVHKRMEEDRNSWKRFALRMLDTTDRAVTLADKDDLL